MANTKLTALTGLSTPTSGDLLYIVDVTDVSGGAAGTSKAITIANLQAGLAIAPSQISGAIGVGQGGTGLTTITSGQILVGNGTGAITTKATTGSGNVVLATSPTLVTPVLGVATATTINKITLTTPATGSTLTLVDGKTLTINNSLTLAGTDGTTLTFQGTDTYVGRATTDTMTNKTLTSPIINVGSDAQGDVYYRNGSGNFVRLAPGTAGNVLQSGGAGANPSWQSRIYCSVYVSASQTIPNNSVTAVAFDASDDDTTSMHSNVTNNSRITIATAGIYLITWSVPFASGSSTGRRIAFLRKNGAGTNVRGSDREGQLASASNQLAAQGSIALRLAASDYLEVLAYQNSGGVLGIGSVSGGQSAEDQTIFQATFLGN